MTTTWQKTLEPVPAEDLANIAETDIQIDEEAAVLPNLAETEYPLKPYENPLTRRTCEPVDGIFWGLIASATMSVNEKALVLLEFCLEQVSARVTVTEAEEQSFERIRLSANQEVLSVDENPTTAANVES